MSVKYFSIIIIIFSLLLLLAACATVSPKEDLFNGIKGTVIPVNRDGKEIIYQEKEKTVINCIPLMKGSPLQEWSITLNPKPDGTFIVALDRGEYSVEIFLKGFYVASFHIDVLEDELVDLGIIKIEEIEAGEGTPVKGEEADDVISNEGDVNIQPPSN